MSGTVAEWLTKARDDLRTVELLRVFDDYPCVVAAFHCQQAVEKSLKAFLTAHNVPFRYRHDLAYLLRRLPLRGVTAIPRRLLLYTPERALCLETEN